MDMTGNLGDKIETAEREAMIPIAKLVDLVQGFSAYQNGFDITISVTPKKEKV